MSITVENIRIYSGIDADGSQYNSNLNSPPADLLTNTDYPRYLSGGIGENYWKLRVVKKVSKPIY